MTNKRKIQILKKVARRLKSNLEKHYYYDSVCSLLSEALTDKEDSAFSRTRMRNYNLREISKVFRIKFPKCNSNSFAWELTRAGLCDRLQAVRDGIKELSK